MVSGSIKTTGIIIPKVSVVIPHYGDNLIPLELINALLRQKDVEIQVILVDDASPISFPVTDGVRVIHRPFNGGFGSTVNTGVNEAIHPLLLILNSDLNISDSFVSEMVSESAPWQPAITAPQITDHDGNSQWVGRNFPTISHQTIEWLTPLARWRSRLHEAVGHNTECVRGAIVPVDWLMGAVLFMPTSVFRRMEGFDENFYMNCEEVDLQRRLRDSGIPSIFLGSVTATHTGGGSSASDKRRRWLVESRFKYEAKWGSPRRLRTALLAASAINFLVNSARQLTGRKVSAWGKASEEVHLLSKVAK